MSDVFSSVCRRLGAAEPIVVLLIAPALLFPSPTRLLIVLIVPVVWLCNKKTTGCFIPPTPINVSLYVLLAMVAVSLFATFDLRFSLGKVSGVVLGVLVFWAVTRWTTTSERLAVTVSLFLAAGGAFAILGLLGTNWIGKFPLADLVIARLPKAIRGVPGAEEGFQPNGVAGCLVLFVPLQLVLLAGTTRRRLQFGHWSPGIHRTSLIATQALFLALTTGTVLLTQSRGAWVGLMAAAMMFFVWHSRRTQLLAVIIAGAVVIVGAMVGPERVVNLAISRSGPGMAGNVSGRMELWASAINGIHDFPITGMGMNGFRKVMPVLYPVSSLTPDFDVAHAHNHVLQAALDLGIPGLIAYCSIWMGVGALLIRVYRQSKSDTYRSMASGLGCGLIAHFVFSMTDTIALGAKAGVLFWFTLAIAVALHAVASPGRTVRAAQ